MIKATFCYIAPHGSEILDSLSCSWLVGATYLGVGDVLPDLHHELPELSRCWEPAKVSPSTTTYSQFSIAQPLPFVNETRNTPGARESSVCTSDCSLSAS